MAIEFHCPSGHILEVDDIHAGAQIRCPACDVVCLVPPSGAATSTQPPTAPAEEMLPSVSPRKIRKRTSRKRGVASRRQPLDVSVPDASDQPAIEEPASAPIDVGGGIGAANRKTLHIECKQCDQVLEFGNEMLGQDLACPACGSAFKAALQRTVEYRQEKKIKDDREDRQLNNRWLYISVSVGLFILAGLLAMIGWSASR
jgi:DNA-directed RNA polymerase subunit RPC12/RpoP